MCDCKSDIEKRFLEKFKEQTPEATGHEVQLKGYAFFFGTGIRLKGVMPLEATAVFPLKKGGTKSRTTKQSMCFSYCPFCGVKYEKDGE